MHHLIVWGLQVTNLLLRLKGFIQTEMKLLTHEILHFRIFFQYV